MPEELVAENIAEVATPQAEPEVKGETKAVSERINQVRGESEKKITELTQQLEKYRTLESTVKTLGFEGNNTDEIIYAIMADREGLTVDDVRSREEQKKNETANLIENDERIQLANKIIRQAKFDSDLAAVKAAYPELTAKSVEELGEEYLKLQVLNEQLPEDEQLDAASIYGMVMARKPKKQPSTGDIQSAGTVEKEFYTSDEVDKFTREDYISNPSLMEKVRNSMRKWK